MIQVRVNKVRAEAILPKYMSPGAAGCDITACVETPMKIEPGKRAAIPTGLAFEIPEGYEIQVRPRSGMAFKQGLTVVNAPGTIDSDFRGEVMILVVNLGDSSVEVKPGDRVAQLVLQQVQQIEWQEVGDLSSTERGAGGFGSTGVRD
jgi:dUTP pyrophosphatase